jgi:TetR/AcrR family transcriptional repressor of nem operon
MVSVLERSVAKNGRPHRATAQGIAALCIGGMIVARTVVDPSLADELRASCITMARELAGWRDSSWGKLAKSRRAGAGTPRRLRR